MRISDLTEVYDGEIVISLNDEDETDIYSGSSDRVPLDMMDEGVRNIYPNVGYIHVILYRNR